MRLLLVDDERDFLEIMQNRLARRNFSVHICSTGKEALEAIETQDFDLAVIDIKMAEMDGIELLQHIKSRQPSLPVLMLTGHGNIDVVADSVKRGASGYLLKPVSMTELIEKMHSIVASAEQEDEEK